EVLHSDNALRFEFSKTEETNIGSSRVWAVGFRELRGPAMIRDKFGRDELTNGTLWIEPDTGRVLKTELNVSHTRWSRAQMVVSYRLDPSMEMLVPASMEEHYIAQGLKSSDGSRQIDCRADYFNFHRFEVVTHLHFGPGY